MDNTNSVGHRFIFGVGFMTGIIASIFAVELYKKMAPLTSGAMTLREYEEKYMNNENKRK